jgi:LysR family transcriptional regulator, hypochlorite-specific transcription factor HypT
VYQHPALALRLDGRQFSHLTLAHDKLVPVARATVQGEPEHRFGLKPVPYLAYSKLLALGRLVEDFLTLNAEAPLLSQRLECDSPDALHEYALKGLGIAWLPWSMVHADCKANRLAVIGASRHEIHFEIRIYRPKRRLSPLAEQVWQVFSNA